MQIPFCFFIIIAIIIMIIILTIFIIIIIITIIMVIIIAKSLCTPHVSTYYTFETQSPIRRIWTQEQNLCQPQCFTKQFCKRYLAVTMRIYTQCGNNSLPWCSDFFFFFSPSIRCLGNLHWESLCACMLHRINYIFRIPPM